MSSITTNSLSHYQYPITLLESSLVSEPSSNRSPLIQETSFPTSEKTLFSSMKERALSLLQSPPLSTASLEKLEPQESSSFFLTRAARFIPFAHLQVFKQGDTFSRKAAEIAYTAIQILLSPFSKAASLVKGEETAKAWIEGISITVGFVVRAIFFALSQTIHLALLGLTLAATSLLLPFTPLIIYLYRNHTNEESKQETASTNRSLSHHSFSNSTISTLEENIPIAATSAGPSADPATLSLSFEQTPITTIPICADEKTSLITPSKIPNNNTLSSSIAQLNPDLLDEDEEDNRLSYNPLEFVEIDLDS